MYAFKNLIENLSFVLNGTVLYQEEGGAVPGQPVRDDGGECVLPGLPAGLPTRGQEGETAYASVHQVFLYIFLATLHQVVPNILAFLELT